MPALPYPNVSGVSESSIDGLFKNQEAMALLADTLMPVGSVLAYAGSSAPVGFLLCDGTAVSRSKYAALFKAISTTYGVGDGSTTFNLPDLRGRVPVGVDGAAARMASNDALGNASGAERVTLLEAESGLRNHSHFLDQVTGGVDNSGNLSRAASGSVVGSNYQSGASGGANASASHQNMPPYQVVNYIVRAG